jgi:FkbM family methyltransferase
MIKVETIHWHTLLPKYLGPHSRVLDLGANYGHFAKAITDRFGCHCVAVEPSPVPYEAIKVHDRISKLQLAIGERSGTMAFRIDENALASSLSEDSDDESLIVNVETLPELFFKLNWNQIDLLKVDIEGAEIGMLSSCTDGFLQHHVAQISIEFHDFCGITAPEIVKASLDRLQRIGFHYVRMSRIGHQDTLLVNATLIPDVTEFDIRYIRAVIRNWFGFKRVASRFGSQFTGAALRCSLALLIADFIERLEAISRLSG